MVLIRLNSGDKSSPETSAMSSPTPTGSALSPCVFTPSYSNFEYEPIVSTSPNNAPISPNHDAPTFNHKFPEQHHSPLSSVGSNFSEKHSATPSFTIDYHDDPDSPIPSVETCSMPTKVRRGISSNMKHTVTGSRQRGLARQSIEQDDVLEEIGDLSNLKLTSPLIQDDPIDGAPTLSPSSANGSRAIRIDSITDGITALRVGRLETASPGLGDGRSPPPSRRRRSGSGINRTKHEVESEDPPRALFYAPRTQQALSNAKAAVQRMVEVLSSSNLHLEGGSSVEGLHQQAMKLNSFQLPSERIVGLVGDSGVGKSSLINSLLDKLDLARASSKGTACTSAVTEYIFHEKANFIINVDYFTLDQLKTQFEELLRAYRDYHLQSSISNDADEDGDGNMLQRKAKLAKETFNASFKEKLEQTPNLLLSIPFDIAIGTMLNWASQRLPRRIDEESFNTAEDCSSRLRELTSASEDSASGDIGRTFWPFIQKLRVYLKAHILSKGLIIADLPGLRDLNSARKAITERYVRGCHQIFVVAKIDRAISDESIKDIFELASRVNLSKIDVICTRSEDYQKREAKHDWPAERESIEEMQRKIDANTRELDDLNEEIADFEQDLENLTREDEQALMKAQQERRVVEKSGVHLEFELFRHITKLRNDKVSNGLRHEYQNYSATTKLEVFCVSNKTYWEFREKPVAIALPYLKSSGILELRQYCIGIVAESRLRATKAFIKDEIPAFLGSVELWIEAGSGNASAETKQQTLDVVSAIQAELEELTCPVSQLSQLSRNLIEEFNSHIYLRMRQNSQAWIQDAERASLDWQGWHHTSYKAFCSNYGSHMTNAIGYRCWNQEAVESMKSDMAHIWDGCAINLESQLDLINETVSQAFGKVLELALPPNRRGSRATNTTPRAMRTLATILRHREDLVLNGMEKIVESFQSEFSCLQADAFSSVRTAFIGKLMESTYHAANMEYGAGSDRRRKTLITGKFGSFSLFEDHRRLCKDKFIETACTLQDEVNTIINEQVDLIEADLQVLRDENVVLQSERNPEFRKRVKTEVARVKEEVDKIARSVDAS